MAVLFDTTVAVLLLRRRPPDEARELLDIARRNIASGAVILPALAVSELLLGERSEKGSALLGRTLERVPTAVLSSEAARHAGAMGAFLRGVGAPIPVPDLVIAATAVWLDIPLLAWDGDYARSGRVAEASPSTHPGAGLWRRLHLHPASLGG